MNQSQLQVKLQAARTSVNQHAIHNRPFQITLCLCFKASLRAKTFHMKTRLILQENDPVQGTFSYTLFFYIRIYFIRISMLKFAKF